MYMFFWALSVLFLLLFFVYQVFRDMRGVVIRVRTKDLMSHANFEGETDLGVGQTENVSVGDLVIKHGARHGITIVRE